MFKNALKCRLEKNKVQRKGNKIETAKAMDKNNETKSLLLKNKEN